MVKNSKGKKNTAHYVNVSVKWAFFSDSFGLRFFSYAPARCAKKAALCQEKYRENIFHSNSPQSHVCTDAPRWQRAAHTHSRRHRQTCTLPLCSPSHPLKTREDEKKRWITRERLRTDRWRGGGRKNFEKLLRHDGCYERKKQKHLMHKKKNEAPQRPSVVTQLYRINTKTRMHVRILTGALYEIKHIMCWTSSCACSLVARLSGGTRTWTLQLFLSLNCLNQINKNVFYFRFTLILKRLSSLQVARGVNALLRSTDCRVRICIETTFLCFTHQVNNQWLQKWEWQQQAYSLVRFRWENYLENIVV